MNFRECFPYYKKTSDKIKLKLKNPKKDFLEKLKLIGTEKNGFYEIALKYENELKAIIFNHYGFKVEA